jgi:cysteine desulfurase
LKKVYFDNAATTKPHPKIKEKVLPFLTDHFGNPSSIHSFGRDVRVAIEEAREIVADFINADASEIYFTSGGTEANNFAINGISSTVFEEEGRNRIITSKADHHAVLDKVLDLNNEGLLGEALNCMHNSNINLDELKSNIKKDTSLLATIHINNETGSVNDIKSLTEIKNTHNSFLHLDGVQSYGKFKIDMEKLGVDTFSASGHKIHALKGAGILYAKNGTPLRPLLIGGPQERNRRGGTENVIGIIAFAEATKIVKENLDSNFKKVAEISDYFSTCLEEKFGKRVRLNRSDTSSPYILSVTFLGEHFNNDAEAMLMFLDINGVAASNGAACTSGTLKPSHVLEAMGFNLEDAQGTIRFSFNPDNTKDEVNYVVDVLDKMTKNFAK